MNLQSERANEISAYIVNHPNAKLADWPIVIGGEKRVLPVYRLPINLLRYNIGNGRFAVGKLILEKELGRVLNYDNPEDVDRIRKMLLEENSELTEKAKSLMEDIRRVGQLEPGVITYDGAVINGNRRMAAIERLNLEEPVGKWLYLDVQRLPEDIGSKNLWRIEAGLQLSKEKKEEYGPMNELLKIKEGIEAGLSVEEVAAAMFEWTPKEVEDALERLGIIDTFLEYVGEKDRGGYGLIERRGLHEFFMDLQNYVYKPARKAGLPRKEWSKRLNYSFSLIWAAATLPEGKKGDRITHWDIRDLKKVFEDPEATDLFIRRQKEAKHPKAIRPEDIRDDLRDARQLISFKRDSQQPRRLIETAIAALKNIDRKSPFFHDEQVKYVFRDLDRLVNEIKNDLGMQTNQGVEQDGQN